jgi:hypothetical protein
MVRKTKAARRAWKNLAREDKILGQIRRAWEQIDAEPGGALGWLVKFTREEASGWLPGEAEAHGHRLLALVYGRQPANRVRMGDDDIPPIAPADVAQLHAELRAFFHALVTSGAGMGPPEGLRVAVIRSTERGEKPAAFHKTNPGGPRRSILFQVAADLVVASDRLIECKMCGQPFLAARKKLFCTATCLQRWHDARRDKAGQRPKKGERA